ncbi:hypothetical protein GGX14DRAFT_623541 [Mycena pura]|uniref:Uncharacterized protein n=1 Tax=Mycena pura TaxID=153505 RepID=A0AAD6VJ03_9AGAR|nr:hypothetical protein GGX14DRAFT_623541 [Mycena pura]
MAPCRSAAPWQWCPAPPLPCTACHSTALPPIAPPTTRQLLSFLAAGWAARGSRAVGQWSAHYFIHKNLFIAPTVSDVPASASGRQAPAFGLSQPGQAEPCWGPETAFGPACKYVHRPTRAATPSVRGSRGVLVEYYDSCPEVLPSGVKSRGPGRSQAGPSRAAQLRPGLGFWKAQAAKSGPKPRLSGRAQGPGQNIHCELPYYYFV